MGVRRTVRCGGRRRPRRAGIAVPIAIGTVRRHAVLAVLALLAGAAAAGCTLSEPDPPYRPGPVTIATGATKGIYYNYGTQLAAVANRSLSGVRTTVVPTTGSVENLRLVAGGRATFAFTAADAASDALAGKGPFARPVPVRALARVYDDYIHLVVPADSPVRGIRDLRGRRVSLGPAGSGTELIADRLLGLARMNRGQMRPVGLGLNESAVALREGRLDAFFWSGGLPTTAVSELATQVRIRLVPLGELAEPIRSRWDPAYRPATIPVGMYGLRDPTLTIAVPDLLVTRADTDPGLVWRLTSLLFSARRQIARAVPVADALDRRVVIATSPVPLHEGALRYYRDTKV
jgi:TRAP transporter TAXI family solute receptor